MKSIYKKLAFLTFTALTLNACNTGDEGQDVPKQNWTLTWQDEFNGNAGIAPDATKWAYDLGAGGWGNEELQSYTNLAENVSLDGKGNLLITAIKKSEGVYTSARIKSKGLFDQKYGRFEARIKAPYGKGIWPAFWMLGSNVQTATETPDDPNTVAWPQCGEIDIMELRGQAPNIINGTIHGPGYSGGAAITKAYGMQNDRFDDEYHIFAVEWNETTLDFYVDDYLYQRIDKSTIEAQGQWVYDHNFFLILNVAVGGNYVGYPVSATYFPQTMTVDYVRVYKPAE